jgi:hypothetical protein
MNNNYFVTNSKLITRISVKLTSLIILSLCLSLIIAGYKPDKSKESLPGFSNTERIESYCIKYYSQLRSEASKPDYGVFKKALIGFFNLKAGNNIEKNILTIIDFSISSRLDRMWIIDMNKMEVVHVSLVAHGRNSGGEFASSFSNSPSSYQSSLGFYLTGGTYIGKHGLSLCLDGVEPGINDKARERAIVIHGADYVSRDFIQRYGRLGRSYGCPSIPLEDHEKIINILSGRSCIYIYFPDDKYLSSSAMITMETAIEGMSRFFSF